MSNTSLRYPSTPQNVDPQILQPSSQFKQEATKVLAAILFFILTYIVLVIAGVGLAALCAAGGIGLILLKPMWITIMLGIGLAGLGVMVLFFLFKFLFKSHKVDRSALIEIKAHEHPRLFEFIRKLAKETQTSFPKKIYLSPDVNASVFYNSSFWSMFLPVRKNLQIGLGLVNAVNLSEFKAIIAHEFGHFSQRSMKLGSYVYNMNHIIFNMLYDNDDYDQVIQGWANISDYFAFFAALTVGIVKGIQKILQHVYNMMNKIYMSLSRQMEYHADTVAASVSGANHLISSLRRLEVADITYNNVFGFYNENFKKGFKADNIYPQHKDVMHLYAQFHELPFEHGLPQIDANSFSRFNKSRIVIKDQWASHPSTDDREAHLRSLKIETPAVHESAWELFDRAEELQQQVTQKVFEGVNYETSVQIINAPSFRTQYAETIERYRLPAEYKGFFDGRHITKIDFANEALPVVSGSKPLETLLSDDILSLPYIKGGLMADIQTLAAIRDGNHNIKSFEFNGRKYTNNDAATLHAQLESELRDCERSLAEADQKLIAWFLQKAESPSKKDQLSEKYNKVFQITDETEQFIQIHNSMVECLMPLYQVMQFDQIHNAIVKLKLHETQFRDSLERMLNDEGYRDFISEDHRKTATEYLSKQWEYFAGGTYIHDSLNKLNESLYIYSTAASERAFSVKEEVLTLQLMLVGMNVVTENV